MGTQGHLPAPLFGAEKRFVPGEDGEHSADGNSPNMKSMSEVVEFS